MISKTDLSGIWQLALDEQMTGENIMFNENIKLPNTTSNAGKGDPNEARETGFLTDTYKFEGWAWFRRSVNTDIPDCSALELFLERTRITEVYVDGNSLGVQESLVAPHVYDLSQYICTGEHELTVRVSNVGYKTGGGHLTSPDTQTNWNGIVGRIELIAYGKAHADTLFVKTDIHNKTASVHADIIGAEEGTALVTVRSYPEGNAAGEPVTVAFNGGRLHAVYPMGEDVRLWSEHSPYLYEMTVEICGDKTTQLFGMREFTAVRDKFCINGRKTFLRGKHDGLIFPKTAYAPCDVEEWLRVMRISRSFGINHYRFHTCCPPEAAFIAADMLGIYMEPQLPFWGTVHAPDEEEYKAEEQAFLISEGFAMMKAFGSHPSFCMMSMGNELWGSPERINEIMGLFKKADDRHLYSQGSNNFQWFPNIVENDDFFVGVRLAKDRLIRGSYAMCDAPLGHIQTEKPAANHSYDSIVHPDHAGASAEASAEGTVQIQYGTTMKTVKAAEADTGLVPDIPIVTHEIGQFETYPNFDEIEKYTGSLKARNFEIFRERLETKGLGHLAKDYFYCSGQLAKACYKEELEAVFRSRLLGGFQILDIQDFSGQGTALVGMLDAFMDNKGIITSEEWREFCNDTVVQAIFDSYTPLAGSDFTFDIRIANFRPESLKGRKVTWSLRAGNTEEKGSAVITTEENYTDVTTVNVKLPIVENITSATLTLAVDGTDIRNHYELEIVPAVSKADLSNSPVFREVNAEAEKLLRQGHKVLIFPELSKLENSIEGFYCQDFWCFPMFASISRMMKKPEPVGTMGLVVDTSHPALSGFACKKYSTPVWWDIVQNSRCEILDDKSVGKNVIVRMIDNFERNHDLALLYEYEHLGGKVVVCTADPEKLAASAEGRVFMHSLAEYVHS